MLNPKLPPVPMSQAAIGLLVGAGVPVGLFYQSGDLDPGFLVALALMLPFVLYYLWSNRAPGGMFVQKRGASPRAWAARVVLGLLMLDLFGTLPHNPDRAICQVVAVVLLGVLLTLILWGRRKQRLAEARP